jgi:hypothetical protein
MFDDVTAGYALCSGGPVEADALVAPVGGWNFRAG